MVEVTGLSRYYGDFIALSGASFRIGEGEIVGLLGLNGAGKSTTLKMLAGLLNPSEGTVVVDGLDLGRHPEALRTKIGYLPEDPPLYRDMTVQAFLEHVGRLKGLSAAALARRVPEVAALTQISDRLSQVIDTLSHGYRKRVGIAQAVLHDPRLLILDEPISGLDPAQIVEMRKVVRGLGAGRGVIVSSHILSEISQTCDRILVVHQGRLVAQGTEEELTQGRRHLRLTLRGETPTWLAALQANPRVLTATAGEAGPGLARFDLTLHQDDREELVADLVRAGAKVRSIEDSDGELERIFLQLTARGGASA